MRLQVSIFLLGLCAVTLAAADGIQEKQGALIRAIHRCAFSSGDYRDVFQALKAFGDDIPHASIGLFAAVRTGREDLIELLLQHEININIPQDEKRAAGGNTYTPLMLAAESGDDKSVKRLLDAGADKTIQYFNQTAEKMALDYNHHGTAQIIRDHEVSTGKSVKSTGKHQS